MFQYVSGLNKGELRLIRKMRVTLFTLLLLSLLIISACTGSSEDVDTVELKFGSIFAPDHVQNKDTFSTFKDEVEELTDGRVTFQVHPGGALGEADEALDNITTGMMDLGGSLQGYNAGKFDTHSVLHLPFLAGGSGKELSIVAQKLYDEFPEIQEEYSDVKPLWVHAADPYAIITKGKEVKTFEDVKGLKLRTPSVEAGEMIESWGATPVSISAPEIYDAMQKGVIDGGVLPIAAIKDFNIPDIVDHVAIGNFNTSLFYVLANKNSWEKISVKDQKLIEENLLGEPMAEKAGEAFDMQKELAEEEALEADVEFYELPKEEIDKFKIASNPLIDEWIKNMDKKGIDGQEIYDETVELINK